MKNPKQQLGRWGENLALKYYSNLGFRKLELNYRTPYGEIDLVVEKQGMLVFVEVKTRSNLHFGQPEEAVTDQKKAHLLASIETYLQAHPDFDGEYRIDVLAIRRRPVGDPEIIHFENAIS